MKLKHPLRVFTIALDTAANIACGDTLEIQPRLERLLSTGLQYKVTIGLFSTYKERLTRHGGQTQSLYRERELSPGNRPSFYVKVGLDAEVIRGPLAGTIGIIVLIGNDTRQNRLGSSLPVLRLCSHRKEQGSQCRLTVVPVIFWAIDASVTRSHG